MTISEVLQLREVESRASLAVEHFDVVGSSTTSIEIGNRLDIGGVDLVHEVLKLRKVED